MIELLGRTYYIDMDILEKFVELKNVTPPDSESENKEQHFSIIKFELIKMMVEVILTEREEIDDNLGSYHSKNTTIPFRIAFNTLLRHNIIKYID